MIIPQAGFESTGECYVLTPTALCDTHRPKFEFHPFDMSLHIAQKVCTPISVTQTDLEYEPWSMVYEVCIIQAREGRLHLAPLHMNALKTPRKMGDISHKRLSGK